jgi:hypothetical protein
VRSKDKIYPDMDPDRTDHSRSVPNTDGPKREKAEDNFLKEKENDTKY